MSSDAQPSVCSDGQQQLFVIYISSFEDNSISRQFLFPVALVI